VLLGSPLTELLLLAGGAALLYAGAELLVKGASDLALAVGLKASTVGVTVVAFATTAPNCSSRSSVRSRCRPTPDWGAIVGSNIANIGLVLGLRADPPAQHLSDGFRTSHPVHGARGVASCRPRVGRPDRRRRRCPPARCPRRVHRRRPATGPADPVWDLCRRARGNAGSAGPRRCRRRRGYRRPRRRLQLAGRWGQSLLSAAGFSDIFIGLTVLALGTSLPELAASVIAAIRGEAEFSVGNVVGSNIYNILAVIGIVAVVTPISVAPACAASSSPRYSPLPLCWSG